MRRNQSGFTLVELAIVVSIIGILAALSAVVFHKSRNRVRATALINDLRVYDEAFGRYFLEVQDYPPSESNADDFPDGMDAYLPASWNQPTPIGGLYLYQIDNRENPQQRRAYILMRENDGDSPSIATTDAVLQIVDNALDDGDLDSGRFIRVSQKRVLYYLINPPS